MRLLLDTHAYLWFVGGNSALPSRTVKIIADLENERFVSFASLWEISIKAGLGKLTLPFGLDELCEDQLTINGFLPLPIGLDHIRGVNRLPHHHGDPFDRLLIAQCEAERLTIVSRDPAFDAYGIKRRW